MICRHNGQSGKLEAQVIHATKWAQGNITTPNSWSRQILQRRASLSRRFSSSKSEKKKTIIKYEIYIVINKTIYVLK